MLSAVIFDFNGVIIDDERLHCRAFARVLAEEGITWFSERRYFSDYLGLDDRGCIAAVLADDGRPAPRSTVDGLVERKAAYYLDELRGGIDLFPGVVELVPRLARALPLAICSGARQHEIEHVLEQTGLRPHFRVIVSADLIHSGKPDPTGYRTTLQMLQEAVPAPSCLEAEQCLVIEDAPAGVEAAHRAGMRCLAVANSCSSADLKAADRVVESLEDVDESELRSIFGETRRD
jgi:HAD superfamily hydrolase (TIGR01509 family)